MDLSTTLLSLSLLALTVTKAADFITTIRNVGPQAETNPLARMAFRHWGFRGGLVAVGLLWVLIVVLVYGLAFHGGLFLQVATAVTGFLVSWAQWDVARFNHTGRNSRFTNMMFRLHMSLRSWLKRWRR